MTSGITQKEAFLKFLQLMDIEMLDVILDDSITYFGASKKVFIEKLSYIFNQVKLSGHSNLKLRQQLKSKNTYHLYVPILSYSNKFIIEEKDHKITNIYSTKIIKNKDDADCLSMFEPYFGDDEKAAFKASPEYAMTLHYCTIAYEELENDTIQELNSSDIFNWLSKHATLFEEVKDKYLLFKFNDFRYLYFGLNMISEQLQNYPEVCEALKSFGNSNIEEWLGQYHSLAYCRVLSFGELPMETDLVNQKMQYHHGSNIYFKGDDFFSIVKFNELYQKEFGLFHDYKSNSK